MYGMYINFVFVILLVGISIEGSRSEQCSFNPCFNGGVCVKQVNTFKCVCAGGYSGVVCQGTTPFVVPTTTTPTTTTTTTTSTTAPTTAAGTCEFNPCSNGGFCFKVDGHFTCICPPGYTGVICQEVGTTPPTTTTTTTPQPTTTSGTCEFNPCSNGGLCFKVKGHFTCVCPSGYTGVVCHIGTALTSTTRLTTPSATTPTTTTTTATSSTTQTTPTSTTQHPTITATCNKPADVIFVLSANYNISLQEFQERLAIIEEYVKRVNVGAGPSGTRVGLISEYGYARVEFHMDDHLDTQELLAALKFVYFDPESSNMGVGLEYINMEGFNTHLGGRIGVQDIVIDLTLSNPNASALSREESTFLQLTGVTQIGAGIGSWSKLDNLNVASGCHYVIQSRDFAHAQTDMVESLVRLTCDAVNKVDCCDCRTCTRMMDVIYLIDATNSDGQTKVKFQYQVDYLKRLTQALSDGSRVAVVTYAAHPHPVFHFNTYSTKTAILQALDFLPYQYGGRNVTEALKYVTDARFPARTTSSGSHVDRVLVFTSVGPYGLDAATAVKETDRIKQLGIKVVSIGIDGALKNEYETLASGNNSLYFPDFPDMVNGVDDGLDRMCSSQFG